MDQVEGKSESNSTNNEPRLYNAWSKRVRERNAFGYARNGDHLMSPFECDRCIFVKLKGCLPCENRETDRLLLATIRRMNLDCFWSRETSTVKNNARRADRMHKDALLLGLPGPFQITQQLPLHDHCGYQIALIMLVQSRRPGKYSRDYTQYDTIRGCRAVYSNFMRSAPQNNAQTRSLGDFKGNYHRLVWDQAGSLFFKKFMEGLRARMGQVVKPNLALSIPLLLRVIRKAEEFMNISEDEEEEHLWLVFTVYVVVSYVISLRGPEGFLLDLSSLNKHWNHSSSYTVIGLLGRLKGERNDLCHLIPCANTTASDINVRSILEKLLHEKRKLGFSQGPAISDTKGKLLSAKEIDERLHDILSEIYDENSKLFPITIDSKEKIITNYQCFRTFRRTSTTRATEMGIKENDKNVINRWHVLEEAKGKRPNLPMNQHYSQLELLIQPFLRYTGQM